MSDVRIERRAYDDPDVVRLVVAVQQEYVDRYGGPDEARVDLHEFAPPQGLFLVATLDGVPVASGGWRHIAGDAVEIKRMYVVPAARGLGLARRVLAELESTAAAAGYARALLGTGDRQPEAIALYESAGYLAVPGFGHYAGVPGALFYGKSLDNDEGPPR